MKGRFHILALVCFLVLMSFSWAFSASKVDFSTTPTTNKGEKWRIGYLEGGPYSNYPYTLRALITCFKEAGWLDSPPIPEYEDPKESSQLWKWMSSQVKSQYIQFVEDAYWSANWDPKAQQKNKEAFLTRIKNKKNIDIMIAMGTRAGQDLANNEHAIPTVVMTSSDPVGSKIIKSVEDSGFDHVHARVDPFRYSRQLNLFNDIIKFKRLGIFYEDSSEGRSYAAVPDVERIAKERGFEIVRCLTTAFAPKKRIAEASVVACTKELAEKVDAIYITVQQGVNSRSVPQLVEITNKYKIPTFSQSGPEEVKQGVLLSISYAGFKYVGQFYVETLAKIMNGAKPRELTQLFEDPPKIAINLKTARTIEWDPPFDILSAADEIIE